MSASDNLKKLFWLRSLSWVWAYLPTLVLFYRERGLSLSDILLLKGIFSFVVAAFEVPTGYAADVFGRKKCLVLGSLVWILSILITIPANSFSGFVWADILLALAISLISGADVALLFDSLVEEKREHEYGVYESRMSTLSAWSEAAGGIIGAALATLSIVYPMYLQLAAIIVFCIIAFRLHEPKRARPAIENRFSEVKRALRIALIENQRLRALVFFGAICSCAGFAIVWFAQDLQAEIGVPVWLFGVLWAVYHLIMGEASRRLPQLVGIFGRARIYYAILVLQVIAFALLAWGHAYLIIPAIAFVYLLRGFRDPLVRPDINAQIGSQFRATVLSIDVFLFRLFYALATLALAYAASNYSNHTALALIALSLLIAGVISFTLLRRSTPQI